MGGAASNDCPWACLQTDQPGATQGAPASQPEPEPPFFWSLTRTQFAWLVFALIVVIALGIDLFGFERHAHVVSTKEALSWSIVWIGLALAFNVFIFFIFGQVRAEEFLAGYLLEKALSVDNLFVFLLIFEYFRVPREAEARVLHWGVLGALIMRAVFIVGGAELMEHFHWTSYIFGALLLYTAVKMVAKKEQEVHLERNLIVRLVKKILPVAPLFDGARFFTIHEGHRKATILLVVVLVVESTDVVFAIDSIPAILAITTDRFVVYTSNVFAIMGLRMLYFLLAGIMDLFHFLKYGLALILGFVSFKLLLTNHPDILKIPIGISLGVIGGVLTVSIVASLVFKPKAELKKS